LTSLARIRVRARAVDMLGRQQIAGIPTAIHELFKNAHDAYAEHVRVDYIHLLDLFLLRDDGLGMTRSDFEEKWLTLGTESKVGLNDPRASVWTGPRNLPRRTTLGEKGIGRLAIAAIGPQVLVLTRAARPDCLHRPTCAFVNWSLFEQPGIDLDEVDVPIIELRDRSLPTADDVEMLVGLCRANVEALRMRIGKAAYVRVTRELEAFAFDPTPIYAALEGPKFDGSETGTHFLIRPTNPELTLDLSLSDLVDNAAMPLQRFLLGFGNTMRGDEAGPPIVAEFWEHRRDGSTEDLIGPYTFFTPDEFASADHHVEGTFDEYGVFNGRVRIYDQVEHTYTIAPPTDLTGRTDCGPFSINFAYVQGLPKDTRMPLDSWKRLSDKLDRIGGLYVYRDGIRILPYGNSDYDWLNIERRRTLSAQDWFFSYRRLFGDVDITHLSNSNLVEKAGREGFRQNKAYRQLVALLQELFKRLAFDFFREKARLSSDFDELRRIKQHEYKILQNRARKVVQIRNEFNAALERFFADARSDVFATRSNQLMSEFTERLDAIEGEANAVAAGEQLLRIERDFEIACRNTKEVMTIARPRQFGMNKRQKQDWEAYSRERTRLIEADLQPFADTVSRRIRELAASGRALVDPRKRLDEPVRRESEMALSATSEARRKLNTTLENLEGDVKSTISRTWSELNSQVENVKAALAKTEVASLSPEEIERRRDRLITQIRESADHSTQLMQALSEQLAGIMQGLGDGASLVDVTAALESENEDLKERVDQYADLAQVGLALGLVQHEFAGQVRNINRGLEALKPWADRNKGLDDLYRRLRVSFEHLESYLQLFVPLNRRLYRRRVPVLGTEIEEFIRTVFDLRFERHHVELVATSAFRTSRIETFPSTILPVFANVVDNAVFWLNQSRQSSKTITLDARPGQLIISNNGPGIDQRDAERMFEFGVSNKPSGRGMGLYLSREALRKERMDIRLERPGLDVPPSFIIEIPADSLTLEE